MQLQYDGVLVGKRGSMRVIQQVLSKLQQKYSTQFNFFAAKQVNRIIYCDKTTDTYRSYKDLLDFLDDTQYLKKNYRNKSNGQHNQVKDRIGLLLQFYLTVGLLQYQYPMMTINNLQDIFIRRHKQIIKARQQQEQSDEEQATSSDRNSDTQVVFEKQFNKHDQYLLDLSWSGVLHGKFQQENSLEEPFICKVDIEMEDEEQTLFESEKDLRRKSFLRSIGVAEEFQSTQISLFNQYNERQLNHLIVDFDDMDRVHVIQQYEKLANKQNIDSCNVPLRTLKQKENKSMKSFSQMKKPLSSSIFLYGDQSLPFTPNSKPSQTLSNRSMMIGSRQEREQEKKLIKRSSVVQSYRHRNFNLSEDPIIAERQGEESPCEKQYPKLINAFKPMTPPSVKFNEQGANMDCFGSFERKAKLAQQSSILQYQYDSPRQINMSELKLQMQILKERSHEVFKTDKNSNLPKECNIALQKVEYHQDHSSFDKNAKNLSRVKSVQNMCTINFGRRSLFQTSE